MGSEWVLSRRRKALTERAAILQRVRTFFQEKGYLEVETPFRIPAPAPEAEIDAVSSDGWFLHTSPELCMKRMLAAGYQRLFQICRCWRAGERGEKHLSEFTMLEWYRAGTDYRGLMQETEELIRFAAPGAMLTYKGAEIDLAAGWERISVPEAFSRYGGMPMQEALRRGLFDEVMVERIEPALGQGVPTFIYDYPACRASLSRLKPEDPALAERFELYIAGVEIANGFSELTDPVEQRERFEKEKKAREASGRLTYPMPEKFLAALDRFPESAGIALGVDRLVMVLLGARSIDEVVAFTTEEL